MRKVFSIICLLIAALGFTFGLFVVREGVITHRAAKEEVSQTQHLTQEAKKKYYVVRTAEKKEAKEEIKHADLKIYGQNTYKEKVSVRPEHQEIIAKVFQALPERVVGTIETLIVDYNAEAYRGLAGAHTVIIRGENIGKEEFASVLVHEIGGHISDLGMLMGSPESGSSNYHDGPIPIYRDDPSTDFYNISWQDNTNKRGGVKKEDFCSGYGMNDPFEDLAECVLIYVLHSKSFQNIKAGNQALSRKYEWIKGNIFQGKEFNSGLSSQELATRPWDATLLGLDKSVLKLN